MKRMHLFEFEDFSWFPPRFRDALTLYVQALHKIIATERVLAPLVFRALKSSPGRMLSIVDFCSGGGGPWRRVLEVLKNQHELAPKITFTDLYPNRLAASSLNDIAYSSYCLESIDATKPPKEFEGLRALICSFYHLKVPDARAVLKNAFCARRSLLIFEISHNSQPRCLW